MKLLSAFAGGLWIIPLGFLLASIYSFYRGYKQWKSGSGWWGKNAQGVSEWKESDEKVPYWSVGANIFGVIFFVFAAICFFWMKSEA